VQRRIHVRTGVNAKIDVGENQAIATRVVVNAVDVEFGVTGPVNHSIADRDGEIEP